MKRVIYAFCVLAILVSCGSSYSIQGTSDVSTLDGRMLYLKVYKDNDFKTVDSCDVVHGQFQFNGVIDTVRMATLYMDANSLMPVVLENGDILVSINNTQQRVSGTPLNEKLFGFMESYRQLENQFNDLGHKLSEAIMNGEDEQEVSARLSKEAQEIIIQEDKLVTSFISDNFDNVLGPGVFFMVTAADRYPELQPWIEEIWSKATDQFKNDSYVKDYYEKARLNEAILNGSLTPETPVSADDGMPEYTSPVSGSAANP